MIKIKPKRRGGGGGGGYLSNKHWVEPGARADVVELAVLGYLFFFLPPPGHENGGNEYHHGEARHNPDQDTLTPQCADVNTAKPIGVHQSARIGSK